MGRVLGEFGGLGSRVIEKFFQTVGPATFLASGTTKGVVTVASTLPFKVKMRGAITHPSQSPIAIEIKRVNSLTSLEVGPIGGKIIARTDISMFPIGSTLLALEQPRNSIPIQELIRACYDEEPTVAWRVSTVDPWGNHYTTGNPFPVNIVSGGGLSETVKNFYGEISALAGGGVSTVVTYTVPVAKTAYLLLVEYSGQNTANYTVLLNGTKIAKQRTWYGGPISGEFNFTTEGLPLTAGDIVRLDADNFKVLGPNPADFEGRILVKEVG